MDAYVGAVARESSRIADLLPGADLELAVPACPGWVLRDLLLHLGEVQRFWAQNVVTANATTPWDGDRVEPDSDAQLEAWFREGSGQLLDALAEADAEAPCWTWWGDPQTALAVARHQVQEVVVHRWDVESCVGQPQAIESETADDGVDEFLSIMMRQKNRDLDQSVGLVSSDTNSIWLAGPNDAPQAATVTATASDLVLLLYGRVSIAVAHIDGDRDAVELLFSNPMTD